jgi:hypothetical protein
VIDVAAIRAEGMRRLRAKMQYATTHDGSEHGSHVLGLIAEYEFARRYGFEVDITDKPDGDGGADFIVTDGDPFTFRVNVQGRIHRERLDICIPEGKDGRAEVHVLLAMLPDDNEETGYRVINAWWAFDGEIIRHCPVPKQPLKPGMPANHMLPVGMAHRLVDSRMDDWLMESQQLR